MVACMCSQLTGQVPVNGQNGVVGSERRGSGRVVGYSELIVGPRGLIKNVCITSRPRALDSRGCRVPITLHLKERTMRLTPNLSFGAQCDAAFKFYERCFGGNIGFVLTYDKSAMAG